MKIIDQTIHVYPKPKEPSIWKEAITWLLAGAFLVALTATLCFAAGYFGVWK